MWLVFFRLLVGIAAAGVMAGANAQSSELASFTSMMNKIVRGTPGVTNVAISTGVRASTSAVVPVAAGGLTIPVATTVSADIGAASIAAGAGRIALRALPWVGTAVALAEIADAVKGSGVHTCPPPDFFCKPGTSSTDRVPAKITYRIQHSTGADSGVQSSVVAACSAYVSSRNGVPDSIANNYTFKVIASDEEPNAHCHYQGIANPPGRPSYVSIDYDAMGSDLQPKYVCPNSADTATKGSDGKYTCPLTVVNPDQPASLEEVNKVLADKANAMHEWTLKMKAEMDAVAQANPELETPINYKNVPITVDAPPVSGPETQVSTRQIPNADGTTSTETVKTQTTVTPTVTPGGTVDTPGVTFPSKTVTTTTTVNNVTNQKTETTNVTNNAAPVEKQELPTDYAREATLKAVLQNLTTPYTGDKPTGEDQLKGIDAQNKTGMDAVSGISAGSTGLSGWLPTIKTATCRNPKVPAPITGTLVDVPICDTVDVFASLISAVIAVFALYGSVREVQAALKA